VAPPILVRDSPDPRSVQIHDEDDEEALIDQEVSNRTKDKIIKHKTVAHKTLAHMDDDEDGNQEAVADEGLAIPDYGGEDIDEEDDEDYGSSEGGNSVLEARLQELQEEI
jgi:hypothetical protein